MDKGMDYDNVMVWLNQQSLGGNHSAKRRRKINRTQRVAANQRERRRMLSINSAFSELRAQIPIFPHEKQLSRIQTLRLAADYIAFMTDIVQGNDVTKIQTYAEPLRQNRNYPERPNMNYADCTSGEHDAQSHAQIRYW